MANITRRGIIAATALAPIATLLPAGCGATPAPAASLAAWQTALADYHAKSKAVDDCGDEDDAIDRHVDTMFEAMDRLVEATPAPHVEALLYKMDLARDRYACSELPAAWMDAFQADIRRLVGRAAA